MMALKNRLAYLLNDLDLTPVARRYLSRHGHSDWTPGASADDSIQSAALTRLVTLVEQEYRKFLVLKVAHGDTHGRVFGAPLVLLEFWEAHVLDTEAYAEMQDRVGARVHYHPDMKQRGADMDADDAAERRMLNTIACYEARFGNKYQSGYLPEVVWGDRWRSLAMGHQPCSGNPAASEAHEDLCDQMLRALAALWSPAAGHAADPLLRVGVTVPPMLGGGDESSHFHLKFKENVRILQLKQVLELLTKIPARSQELKCIRTNRVLYYDKGFLDQDYRRTSCDLTMRPVVRMRGC